MPSLLSHDFERLVLDHVPLIDVRAPIEFDKGAFPDAVNLPLLEDSEREEVGICYKQKGNEKAIALGHKLVSGDIKEARIVAWETFIKAHPEAVLYCFRGGQRSRISQEWLLERGHDIRRIEGGYRAFRHYLLERLDGMQGQFTPYLLGGHTGSGKTLLLYELGDMVDLEGMAKHRGSTFGRLIEEQPRQITFEHLLAYTMIQKRHQGVTKLLFEDEGKHVGRIYLPEKFHALLAVADLIILETPFEERVQITFDEYVLEAQALYLKAYGVDSGMMMWEKSLLEGLARIAKRLGSERHRYLVETLQSALKEQIESGVSQGHKAWVGVLLKEYYDPMYAYQLAKKTNRVLFRGDKDAVLAYLKEIDLS